MRIRVRDLIEELQRFPPDDVVEFEYVQTTNLLRGDSLGRGTVRQVEFTAEFDRVDQIGRDVKIQLAKP